MFDLYKIIKPFLFLLNPEFAHNCIIKYLKLRSYFFKEVVDDKKLKTSLAGINLSNPLGIAAGFDKDGEAIIGINNLGFGFIEVGSVTPRPQTGNPKPRLFRLKEDKAVINRMGFNNAGQISVLGHIRKVRDKPIVIGINLGANKDTKHFLDDYLNGFETFIDAVDFIVINISSPNTPGLTDLQEEKSLINLLEKLTNKRSLLFLENKKTPIMLKISPDIPDFHINNIVDISLSKKIDALIIGNTTSERKFDLNNKYIKEKGGLSGAPIFSLSTKKLAIAYKHSRGKLPIIGVGGIISGQDAYEKICAGATALQIYTSLIYKGPKIVKVIKEQILRNLEEDNFNSIKEAVGSKNSEYLN